jgi:O-antigen ligase
MLFYLEGLILIFNAKKIFKTISLISLLLYNISMFIFASKNQTLIISEAIFMIFLISTILYLLLRRQLFNGYIYIYFTSFIFILLLSSFWSVNQNSAISIVITVVILSGFSILIYNLLENENMIDLSIYFLCWAGIIMCLYSIVYYGIDTIILALINGKRLGADINQINAFGLYSAISFVLCIYFALYKNNKLYYLFSLVPLIISISSGSRKSFLIITGCSLILIAFKYGFKKGFRAGFYFLGIFVALNYLMTLPIFALINRRLEGLINLILGNEGKIDNSAIVRKGLIEFGYEIFSQKPFWGHGTASYRYIWMQKTGVETASHNNYIELLVNNGIFGFLIYYSVVIFIVVNIFKKLILKDERAMIIFILIFIILIFSGVAMITYYNKLAYLVLGISFAYTRVSNHKIQKKVKT